MRVNHHANYPTVSRGRNTAFLETTPGRSSFGAHFPETPHHGQNRRGLRATTSTVRVLDGPVQAQGITLFLSTDLIRTNLPSLN